MAMPAAPHSPAARGAARAAALAALTFLVGDFPARAVDVFVSPAGKDDGDGSATHPFATLNRARSAVEGKAPSTVHVTPGTYYLAEPLVLTGADSGVTWLGAGSGATTIRGGAPITDWQLHTLPHLPKQPVWRARNPFPGQGFYQLVEGQAPATLARFPNAGAGWLFNWTALSGKSSPVAGLSGIRWDEKTGLPPQWEMKYAAAYVWHPYGYSEITGLVNASFDRKEVALFPTPHTMLVKAHFEGSLEFLDEPGEWALGEDDYVYLLPSVPGASPNNMTMSAALAPRLFDIQGTSTKPQEVAKDITIANMSLVGSGWLRNFECEWADRMNSQPARDPTEQWAFTREGMVRMENASSIAVVGCELLAAGTSSVWMEHFAQNCTVEGNWIEFASFTGVHINGWDIDNGKIPGEHNFSSPAEADVSFGHTICNNLISHMGLHVTYGGGIYVHQSHDVLVENNEISWSQRNLISTFGYPPAIHSRMYGVTVDFFTQYQLTTSSYLTFRNNDLSHACGDSQDCGIWEAWCPGRTNVLVGNSFHDHWATMGQAFTMLFPDSANNWWTAKQNLFYNNLQSGVPTQSPGGSTGMSLTGLKGYNMTVVDNIVADSSHNVGVWIGESGGLGGVYTVERNIFANWTQKGQCGGGEYAQAGGSLCYRSMPMVASTTIGGLLNATYVKGVCANASAPPSAKKACINPEWFGFSASELAAPLLTSVNSNLYTDPLDATTAALPKLRPDVDTRSIGGIRDPGFVRTPYSKWWNRTHLDYALAPSSPAFTPQIGFQAADLNAIGLRRSWFETFSRTKGRRPRGQTVQSESADRAFGLYLEPSFGISFPTNPGTLANIAPASFAKYEKVEFGSKPPSTLKMRVCVPGALSKILAAQAVTLRLGSPGGELVARVPLPAKTVAHVNCGYQIGSYWNPGFMNDDPSAMVVTSTAVEAGAVAKLRGMVDLYLAIEGGGHAAIDWFRFENTAPATNIAI